MTVMNGDQASNTVVGKACAHKACIHPAKRRVLVTWWRAPERWDLCEDHANEVERQNAKLHNRRIHQARERRGRGPRDSNGDGPAAEPSPMAHLSPRHRGLVEFILTAPGVHISDLGIEFDMTDDEARHEVAILRGVSVLAHPDGHHPDHVYPSEALCHASPLSPSTAKPSTYEVKLVEPEWPAPTAAPGVSVASVSAPARATPRLVVAAVEVPVSAESAKGPALSLRLRLPPSSTIELQASSVHLIINGITIEVPNELIARAQEQIDHAT